MEELFVRLPGRPIDVDDLPAEITGRQASFTVEPADERTRIVTALTSTRWNKKRAAERLCWSRMTLYRKMAHHQIADSGRDPGMSQCDSSCDTQSAE
jgi:transcriptional regulator of acetoin/glycerol metabolism